MFLGGLITQSASWPWVFYINIPIALVAVFGAVVLLGAFVAIQARRKEPLMPLSIFRAPDLGAANRAQVLLGAAWVPMWFFLNLYLRQVLGYSAFPSGAAGAGRIGNMNGPKGTHPRRAVRPHRRSGVHSPGCMMGRMLPTDRLHQVDRHPAVIDTPLGTVVFAVALGSERVPTGPDAVWRLANGSHLHRWRHRDATVDLLLGRIEMPAWDGGAAVPMWAGIWQVQAHSAVPALSFSAELTDLSADTFCGPDSGECLAAVTAENDRFSVSIGGPDSELLAMQAADGRLMPADWADQLPADGNDDDCEYGVRYLDPAGIQWRLPGLATTEVARLCIATAWCPRDDDRPAAWFAVDIPLDTAYLHLTTDHA